MNSKTQINKLNVDNGATQQQTNMTITWCLPSGPPSPQGASIADGTPTPPQVCLHLTPSSSEATSSIIRPPNRDHDTTDHTPVLFLDRTTPPPSPPEAALSNIRSQNRDAIVVDHTPIIVEQPNFDSPLCCYTFSPSIPHNTLNTETFETGNISQFENAT